MTHHAFFASHKIIRELNETLASQPTTHVLCDIFDTIILRRVHPEYVKKLVSLKLGDLFDIPHQQLYILRAQLEEKICQRNAAAGYDLEFCYDKFLAEYFDILSDYCGIQANTSLDQFIDLYKTYELSIEKNVQFYDQAIVDWLRDVKQQGKKVILVSDFYMSATDIKALLAAKDLANIYDDIVVSSDQLITKRSGKLYHYLLEHHYISAANTTMMLGDNHAADYQMALAHQIRSVLLDRSQIKNHYQQQANLANNKKDFNQAAEGLIHTSGASVFPEFFITCYAFIDRLFKLCVRRNIKQLYFLSREGLLLKQLFDVYQAYYLKARPELAVQSHYLLASRRSTAAASLKPLAQEKFETLFRQYADISLHDFSASYGFDLQRMQQISKKLDIDFYQIIRKLGRTTTFQSLLADTEFQQLYESHRIEQKQCFKQYLSQLGYKAGDPLVVVDVGWKGTIQDNIYFALDEATPMLGTYIGMLGAGNAAVKNNKTALLFDYKHLDYAFHIYNENRPLFEILLNAGHGSPKHYYYNSLLNKADAELVIEPQEQELFDHIIAPIQHSVSVGFENFLLLLDRYLFSRHELDPWLVKRHARMVYQPSNDEIKWFLARFHIENFGVFGKSLFDQKYTATSFKIRLKNLLRFLKRPRAFLQDTLWPTLKFRQQGLAILQKLYVMYRLRQQQKW